MLPTICGIRVSFSFYKSLQRTNKLSRISREQLLPKSSLSTAGTEIAWASGWPPGLGRVLWRMFYFISFLFFSCTVFSWTSHILYSWRTFRNKIRSTYIFRRAVFTFSICTVSLYLSSCLDLVTQGLCGAEMLSLAQVALPVTWLCKHHHHSLRAHLQLIWSYSSRFLKIVSTIVLCRIQSFILLSLEKNLFKRSRWFSAERTVQLEIRSHRIYGESGWWRFLNLQYVEEFAFHSKLSFLLHILQIF